MHAVTVFQMRKLRFTQLSTASELTPVPSAFELRQMAPRRQGPSHSSGDIACSLRAGPRLHRERDSRGTQLHGGEGVFQNLVQQRSLPHTAQGCEHPSGGAALIWMAVPSPNPPLTTHQGGERLCWETSDVKHLLANMPTERDKPSLQTRMGADTPITMAVGALWISAELLFVVVAVVVFYNSKEALLQSSSRQGEWDAQRR